MHAFTRRTKTRGFTMVELMIVLVVAAILVAVAIPNYTAYVQRAQRGHAKATLMQLAQWMERAATATGNYPVAAAVPSGMLVVEGGQYTASLVSTATTFRITATPTGRQATDGCGNFVLDQAGRQTLQGNGTAFTVATCWQR